MAGDKRDDGIKVIHIPEEIKRMSAVQAIMNPPIFPLLRGQEKEQIVIQINELTEEDKLIWTDSSLHDLQFREKLVWYMQVSYLGLEIILRDSDYINQIARKRRLQQEPGSGWFLKIIPNSIDSAKPDHPIEFSFERDDLNIKNLVDSILKQGIRNIPRERNLTKRIWEVLNLRRS